MRNLGDLEDRISWWPDKILIPILSLLTMKEAIKTSVLLLRWKYLWLFPDTLYFDNPDPVRDIVAQKKKNSKSKGVSL